MNITNICYIDGRKTRLYPNDQFTLNIDSVFKNFDFEIPVTKEEIHKIEKKLRKEKDASDYTEFCIIHKLKAILDDDTLNGEAQDVLYKYMTQHFKRFYVIRKLKYNEEVPLYCEHFTFSEEEEEKDANSKSLKINFV